MAKVLGAKPVIGDLVKIKKIRSAIRRPKDQEATLVGLGLNKMHRVRVLKNTPEVQGMIRKVAHLIEIIKD